MTHRSLRRAATLAVATALTLTFAPGARAVAHAAPLSGLPAYDHVAVLVLENENESATYNPKGDAAFLNGQLVPKGAFDPQYYGTGHASLDNYVEMISGQGSNGLTNLDCMQINLFLCVQPQSIYSNGRNLADQLETAGLSWKGYMDSMPSPCFHADYSPTAGADSFQGNSTAPPAGNYADRHNPFNYFDDIVGNDARCKQHVVPYTQLAADVKADRVPSFSFITPDTCHDGHDMPTCAGGAPGGLKAADKWLTENVPSLLAYLTAHNGLLIITSDEAGTSDFSGCCSGGPCAAVCGLGIPGFGGAIGLVALGPHVKAGQTITSKYDHASLLRTIEDLFGISEHLNNAAAASDMADLFSTAPATSTATPAAGRSGSNAPQSGTPDAGVSGASATNPGLADTGAPGASVAPAAAAAALLLAGAALTLRRRRRGAGAASPS